MRMAVTSVQPSTPALFLTYAAEAGARSAAICAVAEAHCRAGPPTR